MRVRSIPFVLGAAAAVALTAAPARAQVKAGPEFRVNTYTSGTQNNRTDVLGVEPDGDFIVTWNAFTGNAGGNDISFGVAAQRYDRSGTPRGVEFQLNTFTTSIQYYPHVAANAKGKFVVVWQSINQDGSSYGVFGQRYDASGVPRGGEFQVNTYTPGYQGYPDVAIDARGNFMVVWFSAGQDGNSNGIFGRRFDDNGIAQGAEFQVNTYTTGSQDMPRNDMDATGRAVVVWESTGQDGASDGVFGQLYDAAGNRVGAEFLASSTTVTAQIEPQVGMAADGSFVVAFEDYSIPVGAGEVRARRFDASGNGVGADFQVNTYTTGHQWIYSIGVDSQGNFAVTWDDCASRDGSGCGVFGVRYSSAGVIRGAEFQANTYTTGYQGVSSLQTDEVGNYVVTWHSDQDPGGTRGVYAQRFGGLFPTALNVNTTGNLVWEPGETVDVRPTWRNHNGAAQTFAGTLSSITGPSGGVYAITDTAGDYGTVADNTSQPCTDCYAVSVDNPSTRPVQHWDASALESISPDTQGQQKRWALHIGGSFTDVPSSNNFYRFVETLLHHSITGGCGGTNYCPSDSTTRDQMSVFVLVAKEGAGYQPPACTTPVFADVPASNPFCRFIEELFRRGVVSGCGGGNYCPTQAVTRDTMAVFVLRTLDPTFTPPACTTPMFADVPANNPFCPWIEELARRGVVTGCGGGNYCPTNPVTREQMGVFISATFGLTLYGP